MPVSLAQIAKRAGVSAAAVSKALRDLPDIAPATRKRIKGIAREMGYRVNYAARSLATQKTLTIGVIVAFPENPTVVERLRGIQAAATQSNYATSMAFFEGEAEAELHQLELLEGRVDGIILTPSRPTTKLKKRLGQLSIPIVLMSEQVPALAADFAGIDDTEGGRLAARHLRALGHKRIAYLGDDPQTPSDKAILAGLKDARLAPPQKLVYWGNSNVETCLHNLKRLLRERNRPTAIFAFSDMAAIWTLRALCNEKLRVPKDMAILGFDDIELARLVEVPLTSIAQPNHEIGQQAARFLLERLQEGGDTMPPRRLIFPPELVVRTSTKG